MREGGSAPARILVVDDHPLVRLGFRALFADTPDLRLCAEAATDVEALRLVQETDADLALVDLSLGEGTGLDLIKRLHLRHPRLALLVCSLHRDSPFAARALQAGARGCVSMHADTDRVLDAVRRVLRGELYLDGAGRGGDPTQGPLERLTDRELEVFALIGQGIGTAAIAARMHLSIKTVESHRDKIKRKLQLRSAGELVTRAVQWRLEQS